MSTYPLNPTPNRVRNLEAYIVHAEEAATKAQNAAQTVTDQTAIATTQAGNALKSAQDAATTAAGLTAGLNAAVATAVAGIKTVRTDISQGLVPIEKLTAKRNISIETGRRYFTGNGGAVTLTPADFGGLVYLESDINTLTFPAASTATDGDYVWIYARGTVSVKSSASDPYSFGFAYNNSGVFVMQAGDRCKISLGVDVWNVVSYTTRHDKALMADRAQSFSAAELTTLQSNLKLPMAPVVQGRLNYVSPTQLRFDATVGNLVFCDPNHYPIPAGGVSISNSGLSANTFYYVYITWNGSSLVAFASPYPPVTHSTYGLKVSGAYAFHTLIGAVYMNASGQFVDTSAFRGVLSYYHRRRKEFLGADVSGNPGSTYVELNTSGRINFIAWGDEAVEIGVIGSGAPSATDNVFWYLTVDGATSTKPIQPPIINGSGIPINEYTAKTVSEGAHYLGLVGRAGGTSVAFTWTLVGSVNG